MDRLTCQRCGADMDGSYRTRMVVANELVMDTAPDGTAMRVVPAAASACSWNCLAVLAARAAGPDADAAVLVLAERERQVTGEDFDPAHDDRHPAGQLALAGICYASEHVPALEEVTKVPARWPWDAEWWKPKNELRDLVRAAALIAAEADRIVRSRRQERTLRDAF